MLESTEINEKDFWTNYKDALQKAIKNPSKNVQALDELDRERERLISRRINETLGERGILLIGRKHLGKFKFDEDITTEIPSPRGFDND